MPLSNDARFGVQAMTEAVNALPVTPTQIRDLQLFKPVYLNTTTVSVEQQDGQLSLVQSKERGSQGDASESRTRSVRTFKIPHLPKNDVVLAEDVQNLRGFDTTQAQTVESTVNDKLADMKSDIEFTREHLALGALQGLVLDADGSTLFDLYEEFNVGGRKTTAWALSTASTKVGGKIDQTVSALRKKLKGEMVSKFVCLCGADFMEKLKYHDSIVALYERYRDGAAYREGSVNHISFEHNGVQFIQYDGAFGTDADIDPDKGIILPLGTRKAFAEYFAPADMSSAVNTKALAYYASREKMKHDKGWDLHTQSNALPLVLRPDLVETVTV